MALPVISLKSRCISFLFTVLVTLLLLSTAMANNAQSVLHSLDYIAVDYPGTVANGKVINKDEYAEQVEFSGQLLTSIASLPRKPGIDAIEKSVHQLRQQILDKAEGSLVASTARNAGQKLAKLYQIQLAPRVVPDLQQAAQLFQDNCASCHGINGFGDGAAAVGMEPAPINFHDRERAMERSVYGLYSAISLGVEGTEMQPYQQFSERQRWALAFYVGNKFFTDEERTAAEKLWQGERIEKLANLSSLTEMTPADIEAKFGAKGLQQLAYMREHPDAVMQSTHPLIIAVDNLKASVATYRSGDAEKAYQQSVTAYLEGFELAEAAMRATDPDRVTELEQQMMAFRNLIKSNASLGEVETSAQMLVSKLDAIREQSDESKISGSAAAVSAAVILLREGLEAILIIAAIAGVLIKTGRRDALPYLHAGWISALALGGVTWFVSTYLFAIGGANRELTEGLTALLAAVVLVYVGFWLHGKTSAKRWREFVDQKIKTALHGKTLWVLTLMAFLAVYREVFETVLFYQALWMQTETEQQFGLWIGIITGGVSLLLLAWLILRLSMRLPLHLFFTVNSIILFVLAIVFTGHGVSALQAAGWFSVHSLPLPQIAILGFYPTLESIFSQLIVVALISFTFLRERFQGQNVKSSALV